MTGIIIYQNRDCHIFIITIIVLHLIVIMDDLSTIFYIIVAIIYVIYSAIKRGKPKNLPQNGPEAPLPEDFEEVTGEAPTRKTQRRPTFEDLLREFTQQQEPAVETQEVAEEKVEQPKPFFETEKPFVEKRSQSTAYDEFQNVEVSDVDVLKAPSVFKAEKEYEDQQHTSGLGADIREMLKSPDGLKKTILLNEIIRPKYF